MNRNVSSLLLGVSMVSSLVWSACSQQSSRTIGHTDKEDSVNQSEQTQPVLITKGATEGEWRVQVEKRWKDQSATGAVIVLADEKPSWPSKEQEALAGSRAWHTLGSSYLASGDPENAMACARRGLDMLGDDYASPMVDDDTDMKLFAAQERIQEGYLQDGAEVMLRVLDERTGLFAERTGLRLAD